MCFKRKWWNMKCLYHYCSNEKGFSILKNKNLRMSDIGKSNDYEELQRFFPYLHRKIYDLYMKDPFDFKYESYTNTEAMREFLYSSEKYWRYRFEEGTFSNFVVCFSEAKDCLSQWRGYADDGKGVCIGFSKDALTEFCKKTGGVLRFEKIIYISEQELEEKIEQYAISILENLRTLRGWIVENMTFDDSDPKTDNLLGFNFDGLLECYFSESLKYKSVAFKEESEWRIFLSKEAYKNPELVSKESDEMGIGPRDFLETTKFLNKKIEFWPTDRDLIPFYPLRFDEFNIKPVTELWLGPKNLTREIDMKLFLANEGYKDVKVKISYISYR